MIGIIFGPPGSGKGTQAAKIEQEFHLQHLSTGDILRHEVAQGTPVGREAARIMAAGDLVPDELIVDIVRRRLPEARPAPACSSTASRARSARPRRWTECSPTKGTTSTS